MEISETFLTSKHILLLVLSTYHTLLFLAVTAAIIFIASRFYKSNLASSHNMNDALARQVEGLQQQLDYASRQETKARGEAERAAAARDKLLSSVSHEIRTPMNGILGMASLLEETTLSADQQEYVGTIISSGKILLNKVNEVMANDMLDHSKIDVVNTEIEQKHIDLRNCIEEVLDMFAVRASENGLYLLYEIDADVPLQVIGDNKRLQQVLINLVENVIEQTEHQEIFIGVHLLKDQISKIRALGFEVGNKRVGDAVAFIQQISKGSNMKNLLIEDEQENQELGLAISKKLVEEMEGEIRILSEETNSDNFIFKIPFQPAAHAPLTAAGYSMKGFEGSEILIVNANTIASGIITNQLQQWKLLPVIAATGEEALEILSKGSVNLVIAEMDMPDTNGIEVAKLIRNKYPKIPFLLMNPLNDERYKQDEETASHLTILNKPVKQHMLFDNILTSLRHVKKEGNAQVTAAKKISVDFAKHYPLRILIAEDNPVNQKWATKILNKIGYQPDIAENGHEVLDMVGQTAYDLILMDVQMPGMDGIEATKMIRVCLTKQPVVIALTANVMHGDRQECMQAGMDDYISKPVELNELVNMLEKWALVIGERKQLV